MPAPCWRPPSSILARSVSRRRKPRSRRLASPHARLPNTIEPRVKDARVPAMDDPRVDVHSLTRRNLGPIKPVKAQPAHWAPSPHPEDAFRATLLDCLAQITANAAALRDGRSVEGLHQLRVAFRRLDTALDAFGKEFGQTWLEELRGRAKILMTRFSPARDLDVFTEKLLVEAK